MFGKIGMMMVFVTVVSRRWSRDGGLATVVSRRWSHDSTLGTTYKRILLEHVLPLGGQFNRQDGDFPAVVRPSDTRSQRTPEDLMPEADADDADAVLLQQLLRKVNQLQNPGVVVERVVFWVSQLCSYYAVLGNLGSRAYLIR
jgi:hypothetical protein